MSVPSVVTGIKVKNLQTDRNFKVTWNAVTASPTITQYSIYRAETNYTGFGIIGTVTATVLQYTDTTIPFSFDRSWFYRVTATNADGESSLAATQAITDFDYLVFSRAPADLDYRASLVDWVENETPSGAINSINITYYSLYNYKPNTLQIFISGGKLLASEFTQLTPNSFTLLVTPTVANSLSINYIKM